MASKFDDNYYWDDIDKLYYNNEREIKAYAKIIYDVPEFQDKYFSIIEGANTNLPYINKETGQGAIDPAEYIIDTSLSDLAESELLNTDIITLEQDKLKLNGEQYFIDGSNITNTNLGLTSIDMLSENTNFKYSFIIPADTITKSTNNISMIYKESIPGYIKIQIKGYYTSEVLYEKIIEDNEDEIVNIELDYELNSEEAVIVEINATNWNREDRRMRLKRIKFGDVEVYNANEILNMTISQTTKKFCTEVPENECSITLNNYDNKFDIFNDKGLSKYLDSSQVIIYPYIGIKDEYNNINYTNMGKFYLENWNNNSDKTTTLNFKSEIFLIKNEELVSPTFGDYTVPSLSYLQEQSYTDDVFYMMENILSNKNIDFNYNRFWMIEGTYTNEGKWKICTKNNKSTKLLDYMQQLAVATGNVIYHYNYGQNLVLGSPYYAQYGEGIYADYINENDYKEEPNMVKIPKINKIRFIREELSSNSDEEYNDIITIEGKTKIENEMIRMDLGGAKEIDPSFISTYDYDNPTAYKILRDAKNNDQYNNYMIYMGLQQLPNSDYLFTIPTKSLSVIEKNIEFYNSNGIAVENPLNFKDEEVLLEIKNDFLEVDKQELQKMAQHYFDYATSYNISFEFNGNPRRNAGEVIMLKVKDKEILMYIEKLIWTYDGGLSCKVEGVDLNGI